MEEELDRRVKEWSLLSGNKLEFDESDFRLREQRCIEHAGTWVQPGNHAMASILRFCSKCGSTLCGIFDGVVHGVTLGCVNSDPEVDIGMHIFVGSKATWEILPDTANQYHEQGPKNA
ncbi:MAG: hypothetical protein KBT82_13540 [Marinobacter sp.]|jgi:hypothetical protein|uniref:hypothetical protein n=1 Tax=Marinobacter sp. TaxID=50741 RepID=UPI001B57E83A|nr:hypothetical protein [Marinobacter sp.]MBQ0746601.1 hypothetical protein [Marinobacter sp.]MBQ0815175.1 hypothetical protein [Marinobacter sp.]|tara:strand:+ start:2035 stop:2388 length:354 start_codon:yes stop_codon:yes gene_type:complete